nr:hypothetical protein [Tanacetum cinerariifolium]GEY61592.1 hypothetical protein [Tanacetum cinerariifolium]
MDVVKKELEEALKFEARSIYGHGKKHEETKLENKTSTSTSAGDYVFSNYSRAYSEEALDIEYKSYVSRKPTPHPANVGSKSGHMLDSYKVSRDVSVNPSGVVLQLSLGWSFFLG